MAYRTIQIKLADGRIINKRVDERGIVPAGGMDKQVLSKISNADFDVDWSDGGAAISRDWKNPHGHLTYDDTYSILLFDTVNRIVTITPTLLSPATSPETFPYYIDGEKYLTSEQSVEWPDVEGLHFFYLDTDGELKTTQSFIVAGEKCITAIVYWDATNNLTLYYANERHSVAFTHADWLYKHLTFGTIWRSGCALADITADGSGDNNAHASFTAETGVIDDEDIRHTLPEQTTYDLFYKLGAAGNWRRASIGSLYGVYFDGTRAAWNEFTGATWQLSTVANLDYVLAHVFATNNLISPFIVVIGQSDYATLPAARAGATEEMNNLITAGLPFAEFIPVASIIYQTSNGYANAVKSRIRTTDTGDDYVNWLGQQLSPTINPVVHNNLSGIELASSSSIYGHLDGTTFDRIPTVDQNAAIDGAASPSASNVFATMDDLAGVGGLSGDIVDALENANNPSIYNVFATMDDLAAVGGLSGDIIDALENANAPSIYNVFATINDLPANELTGDELDAINGANAPSLYNVFATMDDLAAVGGFTINNNANNRVLTATGTAGEANAEANMTFDGSTLIVTGAARITGIASLSQYVITDTDGDLSTTALPAASTTVSGIAEIATDTEALDGVDTSRIVTPAGLAYKLLYTTASTTARGLVELATDAEVQLGLSTEYAITPSGLSSRTATDARTGLVELATDAETQTGTDTTRAITPANLAARTATLTRTGIVELATDLEAQTKTDTARVITPSNLAALGTSDTFAGFIELATQAEVNTGTDAVRAVTPATLKNSTNIPAVSNNADNRVITGGTGQALNGEANLTFDGTTLTLTGDQRITGLAGVGNRMVITDADGDLSTQAIPSGSTTINNNANNRVITGSDTANTLEGEANLTFDGSLLSVTGSFRASNIAGTGNKWIVADIDGDIVSGSIAASESVSGIIEIATQAEVTTGTDDVRAITPLKLATAVPAASETAAGKIEIATQAEVTTGTDDVRAITPLKLATAVPAASETAAGKMEIATSAEVITGTDNARAVSPAGLQAMTASDTRDGLVELATDAETQTGTDTTRAITPANLTSRTATETRTGIVELATDAETQTGTDTTRAITPANLTARTATETRAGIIEIATQVEVDTGTDDVRAVTPLKLANYAGLKEGYSISFGTVTTFNPADNAVYCIGQMTIGTPGTTFNSLDKITTPKLGTIRACAINWWAAGTAGTGENITVSIRKDNTTDYLVQTVGSTAQSKIFANYSMSAPIASGSVIELKVACPAWATNPTTVRIRGWCYIEV